MNQASATISFRMFLLPTALSIVSGILSGWLFSFEDFEGLKNSAALRMLLPGLFFGLAIPFGNRSFLLPQAFRIILYVAISIGAFYLAVQAYMYAGGILSGFIGSFILTLSLPLIFKITWTQLIKGMVMPVLVGTAAGWLFFVVGEWLNSDYFIAPFILWQVLVGFAISWLTQR